MFGHRDSECERERQRDRDTGRERERQRERERERGKEKVPDFVVAANSCSMRGKYAVKCIEMSCP